MIVIIKREPKKAEIDDKVSLSTYSDIDEIKYSESFFRLIDSKGKMIEDAFWYKNGYSIMLVKSELKVVK